MKGLPVTMRLLDPPMHEFLPTAAQLELEIAHLHQLSDTIKGLEELPDTLKLLNPKLYQQYADGLTKLMGGLQTFKESHLEDDVIQQEGNDPQEGARPGRGQPDAGPSRRAAGHHLSGNLLDADPGDSRSRRPVRQRRHRDLSRRSWCRRSPRWKS